jgi:hypothetical protein
MSVYIHTRTHTHTHTHTHTRTHTHTHVHTPTHPHTIIRMLTSHFGKDQVVNPLNLIRLHKVSSTNNVK